MQEYNEPGAVIAPGGVEPRPPTTIAQAAVTAPQPLTPTISPASPPMPVQSVYVAPSEQVGPPADILQPPSVDRQEENDGLLMAWQSQESDKQSKASSWYFTIVFVAVLVAVAAFFLLGRDVLVSVAVLLAILSFAYLAKLNPKEQQYALAQEGIYIGNTLRMYEEFKNFSKVDEASGPAVILIPHKRFASPLILKLSHDSADMAVDTLAQFLPVEQRKADAVDQLMRRIRL